MRLALCRLGVGGQVFFQSYAILQRKLWKFKIRHHNHFKNGPKLCLIALCVKIHAIKEFEREEKASVCEKETSENIENLFLRKYPHNFFYLKYWLCEKNQKLRAGDV